MDFQKQSPISHNGKIMTHNKLEISPNIIEISQNEKATSPNGLGTSSNGRRFRYFPPVGEWFLNPSKNYFAIEDRHDKANKKDLNGL